MSAMKEVFETYQDIIKDKKEVKAKVRKLRNARKQGPSKVVEVLNNYNLNYNQPMLSIREIALTSKFLETLLKSHHPEDMEILLIITITLPYTPQ